VERDRKINIVDKIVQDNVGGEKSSLNRDWTRE
jgi:hypothetical protein